MRVKVVRMLTYEGESGVVEQCLERGGVPANGKKVFGVGSTNSIASQTFGVGTSWLVLAWLKVVLTVLRCKAWLGRWV